MKKLMGIFKKLVPAIFILLILGVPANAADEKYEEFARTYLPNAQRLNEQLRTECGEILKLRREIMDEIVEEFPEFVTVNDCEIEDLQVCRLLAKKVNLLELRERAWAEFVQERYLKHRTSMISGETLEKEDVKLTNNLLLWKRETLDKILQNIVPAKTIVLANIPEVPGMVKIPGQNYYIKKYEVTQGEYKKVMGTNPSKFKGDELPVERVSWTEAMEFCKRLTEIERNAGRLPAGYKYTLPTSEQWEFACRAGTKTRFCSGDSNEDLSRVAWWDRNSANKTHPVGTKAPNSWGIYDMHGNVWEWCLDARDSKRVFRGGSWFSSAGYCESSLVRGDDPGERSYGLGFRIVLVPANDE